MRCEGLKVAHAMVRTYSNIIHGLAMDGSKSLKDLVKEYIVYHSPYTPILQNPQRISARQEK